MMNKHIAIVGRLPILSTAELEAVFGGSKIQPFSNESVIIDDDVTPELYARLGGTTKLAKLLTELPNDWLSIEKYLMNKLPEHVAYIEGKLTIGVSVYSMSVSVKTLHRSLLSFKKLLKSSGHSVRVLLNKTQELSTAEVYHNKLTSENSWELLVISNGSKTYLAQTLYVQNIDNYVKRDRNRPMRDARVGMLPPKLAQTIVNMVKPSEGQTVLDPFCGTGVVLQEALLMGYRAYGTDLEPRMIEYTKKNLEWLKTLHQDELPPYKLEVGDATNHRWDSAPDAIAGETYLGPPLTRLIGDTELNKMIYSVNKIHEQFLVNIGAQINPGTRFCLAVPAWRTSVGYKHLPLLDKLGVMGYNWVKFEHVNERKIIYDREGQFVARQLIVITKV
ncbi:MAG: DNA adenine methylase [bacterium]|nr:DNA adenine methylase [bacterium]